MGYRAVPVDRSIGLGLRDSATKPRNPSQSLADKLGLSFRVSHLPPGTSKWNTIEHRLFSFISINWRGRPLRTYETIVETIGHTTHQGGLIVHAQLDGGSYPLGQKVSPKDFRALNIERDEFHGDWNYTIRPRTR